MIFLQDAGVYDGFLVDVVILVGVREAEILGMKAVWFVDVSGYDGDCGID